MNPWTLVGWIVAIFLLIAFAPLLVALAKIPVALAQDLVADRRLRRAKRGKVLCEHPCGAKATRQTPNGFYCESHFNDRGNVEKRITSGSVSYAFVLDWYKPEFERRRNLNI